MTKYYMELLLCIFSGTLGFHNFYNRQYKRGFLYLVTFAGLGFWYIIDIVNIIRNIIRLSRNNKRLLELPIYNRYAEIKKDTNIINTQIHTNMDEIQKNFLKEEAFETEDNTNATLSSIINDVNSEDTLSEINEDLNNNWLC